MESRQEHNEGRKLATDLSGCGDRAGNTGIRMVRETLETNKLRSGLNDFQDMGKLCQLYILTEKSCGSGFRKKIL